MEPGFSEDDWDSPIWRRSSEALSLSVTIPINNPPARMATRMPPWSKRRNLGGLSPGKIGCMEGLNPFARQFGQIGLCGRMVSSVLRDILIL
jgi:hypothetical protein